MPYDECGKLVVAVDEPELTGFASSSAARWRTACPALRWLDGDELRELEPHVAGVAALHSPHDRDHRLRRRRRGRSPTTCAPPAARSGSSSPVTGHPERATAAPASTRAATRFEFDRLVICAGLHVRPRRPARRRRARAGDRSVPRRVLPACRRSAPPRTRPHLPRPGPGATRSSACTSPRRIDGGVDVGPNAVLALAREGYRRRDVELARPRRRAALAAAPGALARPHWRTGVRELRGLAVEARVCRRGRGATSPS